jgi:hypothetical protein
MKLLVCTIFAFLISNVVCFLMAPKAKPSGLPDLSTTKMMSTHRLLKLYPLKCLANEDSDTDDETQSSPNSSENSSDGMFKLSKKSVFEDPAVPFGTSSRTGKWREPSPLSDNLIVLGSTVAVLMGLVGFFLFLNKDIAPPQYDQ